MAEWLAAHGWTASIVTWKEDPSPDRAKGVDIFNLCSRDDGWPGLRFFLPRWTSLNSALDKADADIYYYNCGDMALGQLAMWANRRGVPYVYSVPSDPDCDPDLPALQSVRERVLYRYGLRHCNHIIVQSDVQRQLLETGFGKSSVVHAMPCKGFAPREDKFDDSPDGRELNVIWVGRISPEKRVEWLLDVAEACAQVRFTIIGAPNQDTDYARQAMQRANALPNVSLAGRVSYDDMAAQYRDADVLCCTSVYEGFPNVFLEAWSAGVPVISTVDPDGVIRRNDIGFHCESTDRFVDAINRLDADVDVRRSLSVAAREYFHSHHEIDTAMRAFDEYFRQVLHARRPEEQAA